MAFFDDLGRKFSEAGQKVMQKTGEMSDTSRLNAQINDEENRMNGLYLQLGKLYMTMHRDDPETEMAEIVQSIIHSEKTVLGYREQLQRIKGIRTCTRCGREVSVNGAFCTFCGNPMPVENASMSASFSICAGCGSVVEEGMRFCTHCGRPVVRPAAEPTSKGPNAAGDYAPPASGTGASPASPVSPVPEAEASYMPPAPPVPEAEVAYMPPVPPTTEAEDVNTMPAPPTTEAEGAYPTVGNEFNSTAGIAEASAADSNDAPAEAARDDGPELQADATPAEAADSTPAPSDSFESVQPVDTTIEPVRFCPSCGAPVESGDAFCMICGAKL